MSDTQDTQNNEKIMITDEMIRNFVKEIIELEQDNLYVNRANLKEKIASLAKTKVR